MTKVLMKGNEALGEAAIRAGCVHFFGYPITPQTEVPEYLVKRLPEVGGTFVQAESEVASINMIYGAAGVGVKCLTSSSSPGISLMAEGMSYIAACELPCVIINIMRAGPGLGGILPAQGDYFQATRGHGHGDYEVIVLAPASVQEAVDLMMLAFDLAETYRNPVMVCADGMIGQMMEPVEFPTEGRGEPLKDNDWALTGCEGRERRIVNSLYLTPEINYEHNLKLKKKYDEVTANEQRWELYGAGEGRVDLLVVAFGTMARICKSAIDEARNQGLHVALFRPITLWPFPYDACRQAMDALSPGARVLDVEMNMGQMISDVRQAAEGTRTIEFFGKAGGIVPSPDDVLTRIHEMLEVNMPTTEPSRDQSEQWPPCSRAQADGVPCQELGRDCEKCEEAYPELTVRKKAAED
jgi:2-oxoglutarate ferredoxin oxidoreductase subunit alpha